MCGRFNLTKPEDIEARFGFVDWHERRIQPRFNIAPSQEILTIVQGPDGPAFAQLATWGFKPAWFKSKQPPPINARAETLASSGMFRPALKTGRCLIPATGFYEWRNGQPMHIRRKDGGLFAFAGLWLPPAQPDGLPSAAIITTRPNELLETIHTRMPAILRPEDEQVWLQPSPVAPLAVLGPYPAELMEAYAVARLVNSVANEGPELLAPSPEPPAEATAVRPRGSG